MFFKWKYLCFLFNQLIWKRSGQLFLFTFTLFSILYAVYSDVVIDSELKFFAPHQQLLFRNNDKIELNSENALEDEKIYYMFLLDESGSTDEAYFSGLDNYHSSQHRRVNELKEPLRKTKKKLNELCKTDDELKNLNIDSLELKRLYLYSLLNELRRNTKMKMDKTGLNENIRFHVSAFGDEVEHISYGLSLDHWSPVTSENFVNTIRYLKSYANGQYTNSDFGNVLEAVEQILPRSQSPKPLIILTIISDFDENGQLFLKN